jgi:hypothetical protein
MSGGAAPPPPVKTEAPKHVQVIVAKPGYSVETVLGAKQRTDSF